MVLEVFNKFKEFTGWESARGIYSLLKVFQSSTKIMESEKIAERYNIAHPKVIGEIFRNEALRKFLAEEAYLKIKEYFPETKELVLDYSVDPESGAGILMLYIVTEKDPEEALKALERFDTEWWLYKAPKYKNLCIHLRLV